MEQSIGKRIIDDITITINPDVQFQQEFANPLLEHSLDIRERSIPDYNYKNYFYMEHKPTTNLTDSNFEFIINSPHPWKLNSLFFDITVKVKAGKQTDAKDYPMANFFNGLFSSIKIFVGENTQQIDHIDQFNQQWGYIWKYLETTYENYIKHEGPIDLFIPDSPGAYQPSGGKINDENKGGKARLAIMYTKNAGDTEVTCTLRGKFQPNHLLFQKDKMWPPYQRMKFNLCLNEPNATMIRAGGENVDLSITDFKVCYSAFEINQGAYEKFEKQFIDNLTAPKDLAYSLNPYKNPLAIYNFLDVRASVTTIPQNQTIFNYNIRMGSILPKGLIFCLSSKSYRKSNENHLEMEINPIRCYEIRYNSQTRVPCKTCRSDTSAPYQDFYQRLRNYLGARFTALAVGVPYEDFVGGAGFMAELFNPQDSLNVHSKIDTGNLELIIELMEAKPVTYQLYTFLIFDQTLVLDERGNGNLVIGV